MTYLISIIHIITCVLIVVFILLQNPKGGGVLGSLGGSMGSQSLFSSGGVSDFFVQTTKWLTVVFAITSISLSLITSKKDESLMETSAPITKTKDAPSKTKETPSKTKN